MDIEKIIETVEESDYWVYGIRADSRDLPNDYQLEPSHDWFQDYPGECEDQYDDPDYPFDEEMDCWDGGELNGTCAIDFEYAHLQDTIKRAMKEYLVSGGHVYLIAGNSWHAGNDVDEIIIRDAVVLAKII